MRFIVDAISDAIMASEKYRKEKGWETTTEAQSLFLLTMFNVFGGVFKPKDPKVRKEYEALLEENGMGDLIPAIARSRSVSEMGYGLSDFPDHHKLE